MYFSRKYRVHIAYRVGCGDAFAAWLIFTFKTKSAAGCGEIFLSSCGIKHSMALSQILCKRRNAVKTEINILPAAAVNPLSPY